jgi:hypothetical protein
MMQERRNNLVKLAHHRVVALALRANPGLLDEAREVVRGWLRDPEHARFADEWYRLLSLPVADVRREITRRTPEAERLRVSSPFALTPTEVVRGEERGRLWGIATRLVTAQ